MTTPTYYAVKSGYDQPDVNLVAVSPQPRMAEPVHAQESTYYASSASQFNGMVTTDLQWNIISAAERASLLTQYGVSTSVGSNQVTQSLNTDRVGVWTRYNCQANYLADEKPTQLGFTGFHLVMTWLELSA